MCDHISTSKFSSGPLSRPVDSLFSTHLDQYDLCQTLTYMLSLEVLVITFEVSLIRASDTCLTTDKTPETHQTTYILGNMPQACPCLRQSHPQTKPQDPEFSNLCATFKIILSASQQLRWQFFGSPSSSSYLAKLSFLLLFMPSKPAISYIYASYKIPFSF